MELVQKQCRGQLELPWLLLFCQDLCVRTVCFLFQSCPCFFKETMELLCVYRKMIFQLDPYIWQLWIAMFLSLSFLFSTSLMEGQFGVLSGKMTFPLFTSVSLYCKALAFLLLSSFLCWTLLLTRRHCKARRLTKAGPEGEEWGQPLT